MEEMVEGCVQNRDQNFVRPGYNTLVRMQWLHLLIQSSVMFHWPVFPFVYSNDMHSLRLPIPVSQSNRG